MDLSADIYLHVSWASCKFPSHSRGKGEDGIWIFWAPLRGTTFSSHPIAAAFPKAKQLVGGSEKVTTCLPPGGVIEPESTENDRWKEKQKFHLSGLIVGLVVMVMSPPLHLFSLTCFLICYSGRRFFSFSHFPPCSSHVIGYCPGLPLCFWTSIPSKNVEPAWVFVRRFEPGLRHINLEVFEMHM